MKLRTGVFIKHAIIIIIAIFLVLLTLLIPMRAKSGVEESGYPFHYLRKESTKPAYFGYYEFFASILLVTLGIEWLAYFSERNFYKGYRNKKSRR